MMNIKKTVVFLAGGLGSRYKGLKQVECILENGSPILEYSLYDAIESGFTKFVFIISEAVPKTFINKISAILDTKNLEYHWVIQRISDFVNSPDLLHFRQKPWGTGHAVLCAKDAVHENFLVINADDFYGRHSFETAGKLIDLGKINTENYALVGFVVENTLSENGGVSRGLIAQDAQGKLQSVVELININKKNGKVTGFEGDVEKVIEAKALVSMNFWIFHPRVFSFLETEFQNFLERTTFEKAEFFLPELVDLKVHSKEISVEVLQSSEIWKGVTYPEDKAEVALFLKNKIQNNIYPENLWN